MAGLTRSSAELSLLSLAMAVTASLWLLFAQPAQGHRALRPASFGRDAAHTDSLGIPVESDYECGYFNLSDPKDAGIPHQPCYGDDGIIQFCW